MHANSHTSYLMSLVVEECEVVFVGGAIPIPSHLQVGSMRRGATTLWSVMTMCVTSGLR